MSLTQLQSRVEQEAALHLPDLNYSLLSSEQLLSFMPLPLEEQGEGEVVGVEVSDEQAALQTQRSLFTQWSRSQLLSHLGTREKWFRDVTRAQEAAELNLRRPSLGGFRLRLMKAADPDFPYAFVRGIVSSEYAEIKNTDIMEAVVKSAPASTLASTASGITDRAFYAYVVSADEIGIPGTRFRGQQGAAIINSEVGYTSLWVIPALFLFGERMARPIVFEKHAVLKRIHRGRAELGELFVTAFAALSAEWGKLSAQMPRLASLTYTNQDHAIATLERLLEAGGAKKELVEEARKQYRAKSYTTHDGLSLFEAVCAACETYTDRDATYSVGAIAGAVLYTLLHT